jgi:site-specific recombinase XerD
MITLEKCLQQFKEEYSFRLTDGTLLQYIIATEQLIDFCNKSIYEIDLKDIRRWMSSLDSKEYKAVTVKTKLAGIKLFFKYCVEDGFLIKNPAIK